MREADFIVVGSGSTGSPLAAKLSEDPNVSVTVIEAGGEPQGEAFDIPSQWGRQFASKYDWCYMSELEPHLGMRRTFLPRGKVLGGTSSMNAMLYVRGVKADYDEWESRGATGWGWDEFLPYFINGENNVRGASELHGDKGPLFVQDRISDSRLAEAWLEAALAAGHKANDDFNGPDQEGVGYYQLTQNDGKRWSAYEAFLKPAQGRANLEILTYRHVTRLIFEGRRVVGVEVEHDGRLETIRAKKEVILSAGAYNTPQILMLSGIGPREHLNSLGIEVVADLPVGEGLQDHPGIPLVMATDQQTLFDAATPEEWENYRRTGRGILASNGVEAGGFIRTNPGLADCDVQIFVNPWPFMADARTPPTVNGFTAVVELLRPRTVGWVRLRNTEPTAQPLVTTNHFDVESDMTPIREGAKMMFKILERSPIAGYNQGALRWPSGMDDEAINDYMRQTALGYFHPSSTAAMGTVLDGDLRVREVEGLRVADASAMPTTMRGNPNAACIAMGEKAADILAADHGLTLQTTLAAQGAAA